MGLRPLNLVIRGHVRSAFENDGLRQIVHCLSDQFETRIYAQTWNVVQNSISWRKIPEINDVVDEEAVRSYLDSPNLKSVIVLDDSKIRHHGNTEGNIGRTPCPILAWKNMYYGKFVALESLVREEGPDEVTYQFRFDTALNSMCPKKSQIMRLINKEYQSFKDGSLGDERIRFTQMKCVCGVDNAYIATAGDMYRFVSYMYYEMDRILEVHKGTINQEHIAFHERKSFHEWSMPSDFVDGPAAHMYT